MLQSGIITLLIIVLLVDIYLYRAFKKFIQHKIILVGFLVTTVLVLAFMVYNFYFFDRKVGQTPMFMWSVGFFILNFLPRLFFFVFFALEDFIRLGGWLKNRTKKTPNDQGRFIPERRKFIYQIALAITSIPFIGIVHGLTIGKYNYKLIQYKLSSKFLPKGFEGLKILQISDIHSGSLDNKRKIEGVIELINQQDFDLLLFTGDIVNNFHWEMDNWISVFQKIKKAPYGNFAILGNHDYGEYSDWDSEEAKQENFEKIKEIWPKLGFELLLNENRIIEKNGEKIALIGVENWGANFIQRGDLSLASQEIPKEMFKILMSHDPSHWELEVKNHPNRYDLTLAGHTHGTQFGIEVPSLGLKWSPAQYVYKQWAGLYEHKGRVINVNRGFGYHFFPGRVGIWPEITCIELTSK